MRWLIYILTGVLFVVALPQHPSYSQAPVVQIEANRADLLRWRSSDMAGEYGFGLYGRQHHTQHRQNNMAWWAWNIGPDGRTPRNPNEGRVGLFFESRYFLPAPDQRQDAMEFYLLYAPVDGPSYRPYAAYMYINEPHSITQITGSEIWIDGLDYTPFIRLHPADGYGTVLGAIGQWGQLPPGNQPVISSNPTTAELAAILTAYGMVSIEQE